jgi:hypothetical protein
MSQSSQLVSQRVVVTIEYKPFEREKAVEDMKIFPRKEENSRSTPGIREAAPTTPLIPQQGKFLGAILVGARELLMAGARQVAAAAAAEAATAGQTIITQAGETIVNEAKRGFANLAKGLFTTATELKRVGESGKILFDIPGEIPITPEKQILSNAVGEEVASKVENILMDAAKEVLTSATGETLDSISEEAFATAAEEAFADAMSTAVAPQEEEADDRIVEDGFDSAADGAQEKMLVSTAQPPSSRNIRSIKGGGNSQNKSAEFAVAGGGLRDTEPSITISLVLRL